MAIILARTPARNVSASAVNTHARTHAFGFLPLSLFHLASLFLSLPHLLPIYLAVPPCVSLLSSPCAPPRYCRDDYYDYYGAVRGCRRKSCVIKKNQARQRPLLISGCHRRRCSSSCEILFHDGVKHTYENSDNTRDTLDDTATPLRYYPIYSRDR